MTNKRLILIGLAGIALLLAVGALAVLTLSDRPAEAPAAGVARPTPPAPSEAPPRFVPATVPPEAPAASPAAAQAPRAAVPRSVYSAMRVATGPEGQVVAGERRRALRALRGQLMEGFAALRQEVDACGAKDASFVLALEAADGAVIVQGARVEERGGAPDGALSCAQSALAGKVIPAPSMSAGRRWEAPL